MSTFILGGLLAFFVLTGSAGHASAPEFPTHVVTITGYNAVPGQTDGDPSVTASGAASNPSVVAARSRDLADELPFGTVIAIEPVQDDSGNCGYSRMGSTIGYRVIADTMNARIQNTVDILLPNNDTIVVRGRSVRTSQALGVCENVTIKVVGKIDLAKPSTLPKTQSELAALVGAAGLAIK